VRNGGTRRVIAFSSSRKHGPEADEDEAGAGDEFERRRLHETLDLGADQDADGRGQDQGAGAGGEDDPLPVLALRGEEHRRELGFVADLGEEDGDEDGGEGFPHGVSLALRALSVVGDNGSGRESRRLLRGQW
jgi:hypothetical protein